MSEIKRKLDQLKQRYPDAFLLLVIAFILVFAIGSILLGERL